MPAPAGRLMCPQGAVSCHLITQSTGDGHVAGFTLLCYPGKFIPDSQTRQLTNTSVLLIFFFFKHMDISLGTVQASECLKILVFFFFS